MITIRKSKDRGHVNHGWLDSFHTFSFGDYHDPAHMGFRALRVINEDRVAPGQGFGMHQHRDMEIVSYVLEGSLEHRDSMGHQAALKPGEVQRISAGSGIAHSEYNPSREQPVHFLQIWLLPDERAVTPAYEQRDYPIDERTNRLRLIVSRDGRDDSISIHQDADIFAASLDEGAKIAHSLKPDRHAWIQTIRGVVSVNGHRLESGDAAAVSRENVLRINADSAGEVLVFDLA